MPDDDLPDDSELPQVDDAGNVSGGSSSFGQWFQQHQRAVFIIGGITLLLTVYLIFRKSSAGGGTTAGVPTSGPPQPGMTSDTAAALNQQTTLLEALAQAVANLQKQQVPPNPGPVPNPTPKPEQSPFSPEFLAFLASLPSAAQQRLSQLWAALTQQQQQQFEALPLAQQEAWVTQQIQGLQTLTPPGVQLGTGPGGVNPPTDTGTPQVPPFKVNSGIAASALLPTTNVLHFPLGMPGATEFKPVLPPGFGTVPGVGG